MKTDVILKQIDDVNRKRSIIESELAELRAKQAGDMGADVEKAVKLHRELTAEIGGRESVLRTLTAQLDRLSVELTAAQEEAKAIETAALSAEIEAHIIEVEDQMLAILPLAQDPELKQKINRYYAIAGPFAPGSYTNRLAMLEKGLTVATERRETERRNIKRQENLKRMDEEQARARRQKQIAGLTMNSNDL